MLNRSGVGLGLDIVLGRNIPAPAQCREAGAGALADSRAVRRGTGRAGVQPMLRKVTSPGLVCYPNAGMKRTRARRAAFKIGDLELIARVARMTPQSLFSVRGVAIVTMRGRRWLVATGSVSCCPMHESVATSPVRFALGWAIAQAAARPGIYIRPPKADTASLRGSHRVLSGHCRAAAQRRWRPAEQQLAGGWRSGWQFGLNSAGWALFPGRTCTPAPGLEADARHLMTVSTSAGVVLGMIASA